MIIIVLHILGFHTDEIIVLHTLGCHVDDDIIVLHTLGSHIDDIIVLHTLWYHTYVTVCGCVGGCGGVDVWVYGSAKYCVNDIKYVYNGFTHTKMAYSHLDIRCSLLICSLL